MIPSFILCPKIGSAYEMFVGFVCETKMVLRLAFDLMHGVINTNYRFVAPRPDDWCLTHAMPKHNRQVFSSGQYCQYGQQKAACRCVYTQRHDARVAPTELWFPRKMVNGTESRKASRAQQLMRCWIRPYICNFIKNYHVLHQRPW